jgi:UPF0755 protein
VRKLLTFVLVLAIPGLGAAFLLKAPVGPTVETFVVVPPRTGARDIAALLQQRGIIWNQYAFLAWRAYRRGTLKAGEYRFDRPAAMTEVYARLQRGDVYTLAVTVPEGFNLFDTAAAFETAKLKPASEFLAGARANVDLVADIDPHAQSLEGYLFPDTYRFPPAMSVRDMQAAMVRRFRQRAAALGLTSGFHDAVTMASLVEKETGAAQERGLVASVFTNRLAKGMPLATDPSVIYGLLLTGAYRGTLYASDLKGNGLYNTYTHTGLPPGPICNPGVASLTAALRPPVTQYLYFVSDNAGHSRFAATLEEHDKNVASYRHALKVQGGR